MATNVFVYYDTLDQALALANVSAMLKPGGHHTDTQGGPFGRVLDGYEAIVARLVHLRYATVPLYLIAAVATVALLYVALGTAIFPPTDKGQFVLRLKAPTGTRIERTEELAREATRLIKETAGAGNVAATVGYVGTFPTNYPVQGITQWTSGPGECLLKVALAENSGINLDVQKEKLRARLDEGLRSWLAARWREDGLAQPEIDRRLPGLRLSFEPGDIVSDVMSFGSPTPVEVPHVIQGQVLTERFSVNSLDGSSQVVSVSVTGVNNVAVVSGTAELSIAQGATAPVQGQLVVKDVDAGEAVFRAGTQASAYGQLQLAADGTWRFALQGDADVVKALREGDVVKLVTPVGAQEIEVLRVQYPKA